MRLKGPVCLSVRVCVCVCVCVCVSIKKARDVLQRWIDTVDCVTQPNYLSILITGLRLYCIVLYFRLFPNMDDKTHPFDDNDVR